MNNIDNAGIINDGIIDDGIIDVNRKLVPLGELYTKFHEIEDILIQNDYKIIAQNKIIKLFVEYSKLYTIIPNDDDDYDEDTIFTVTNRNGNNLLLYCCISELRLLCNHIIEKYSHLFNIGKTNDKFETALIISIKKNMFDVANNLLAKPGANLGQEDGYRNTALALMLEKPEYDAKENTLTLHLNRINTNNYIEIILKLLQFYADKVNSERSQIDHRGHTLGHIIVTNNYKTLQNYIDLICADIDFWEPLLSDASIVLNGSELKFTRNLCKSPTEAEISFSPYVSTDYRDIRPTINFNQRFPIASTTLSTINVREINPNRHVFPPSYEQVPKPPFPPQQPEYYDLENPPDPRTIIRYPPPPEYIPNESVGTKRQSELNIAPEQSNSKKNNNNSNNNSDMWIGDDTLGGNKRSRIRKRKKHTKSKKSKKTKKNQKNQKTKKTKKSKTQNKKPKKETNH